MSKQRFHLFVHIIDHNIVISRRISKGMILYFWKRNEKTKQHKTGIKDLQKLRARRPFPLKVLWLKWLSKARLYYPFFHSLMLKRYLERKKWTKKKKTASKDPISIPEQKQKFLPLLNRHLLPSPRWRETRGTQFDKPHKWTCHLKEKARAHLAAPPSIRAAPHSSPHAAAIHSQEGANPNEETERRWAGGGGGEEPRLEENGV